MKISSVNNLNFGAKLISNMSTGYSTKVRKSLSKEEISKNYDNQIKEIKKQKKVALELDEFLKSDEINELIKQLPEDDEVEIISLLNDRPMRLEYYPKATKYKARLWQLSISQNAYKPVNYNICPAQNEEGELDKNGIKTWLEKVANALN